MRVECVCHSVGMADVYIIEPISRVVHQSTQKMFLGTYQYHVLVECNYTKWTSSVFKISADYCCFLNWTMMKITL